MKDEFKGTPGPWAVVGACCDGVGADFDSGGHKSVCQRPARTGGKLTDEYNANMHLIAAAPELLEALRQLRDYVEDVCAVSSDDCHDDHPLNLANKAIKKALGKKQ